MKKYKNIILTILILTIIFININAFAAPNSYTKITDPTVYAKVTQVIDGDAIKVKLSSGQTAYIKLAGINSKGSDDAYSYLLQNALGAEVLLIRENSQYSDKWNYMLVYANGKNLNEDLLQRGYATIDRTQEKTSINSALISAQNNASAYGLGLFAYNSSASSTLTGQTSSSSYKGDKVNINTATSDQLSKHLNNITPNLASEIISYRNSNPFSNIKELKFVPGISRDIYNQNRTMITVSTNINTAGDMELKTLGNLTDAEINEILKLRSEKEFKNVKEIQEIVSTKYSKIEPYISVSDVSQTTISINSYVANINGADKFYLTSAGLFSSDADKIIAHRKNGYTYKTLMELTKLPNISLTEKTLNSLEDNLQPMTNLNPRKRAELESIFSTSMAIDIYNKNISTTTEIQNLLGKDIYNKVKDYVYATNKTDSYTNLNTATQDELIEAGLSFSQANQIISARPIKTAADLPFNIQQFNKKLSIYTNINTATAQELMSLNNGISLLVANSIIDYVKDQPFGSLDELKLFLDSMNATIYYNKIKDFLVFR